MQLLILVLATSVYVSVAFNLKAQARGVSSIHGQYLRSLTQLRAVDNSILLSDPLVPHAAPTDSAASLEEMTARALKGLGVQKKISILGSTGSIGTQTLDICRDRPAQFKCVAMAAGKFGGIIGASVVVNYDSSYVLLSYPMTNILIYPISNIHIYRE